MAGSRDVDVGHVDALALADQAVVLDDAGHVLAVDGLDLEGNQAVIDQDEGALLDLGGQGQVVEGDVLSGAVEILGRGLSGDDDLVAGLDGNLLARRPEGRAASGPLVSSRMPTGIPSSLEIRRTRSMRPWCSS